MRESTSTPPHHTDPLRDAIQAQRAANEELGRALKVLKLVVVLACIATLLNVFVFVMRFVGK